MAPQLARRSSEGDGSITAASADLSGITSSTGVAYPRAASPNPVPFRRDVVTKGLTFTGQGQRLDGEERWPKKASRLIRSTTQIS
jgi:hypothetical protein